MNISGQQLKIQNKINFEEFYLLENHEMISLFLKFAVQQRIFMK